MKVSGTLDRKGGIWELNQLQIPTKPQIQTTHFAFYRYVVFVD